MAAIRMGRAFLTVGAWTLVSRVAGFGRDILMAAYLGAGPVAEAFLVAFSLPNLFRRFFAEGAFNMAFVPMYAKKLEAGEDATGFARDAFNGMAALLVVFAALGTLAMPWLVWAMAAGFAGDERFGLAVLYGRIGFVYILFVSLVALLSGVLNARGRFVAAAAVPVMLNLLFIAGMLLAGTLGWDIGLTLALTVPVAGAAQFALTWWAAARAGFVPRLQRPRLTPELRRLAVIAAPAVLAGGVVQINLLVGRQVASFTENAVAWLSYADRLYQLPLGVVGIAIGTVLLPDLARRLRAGDAEGGRASFNRGLEFGMALTLPSAVALVVMAMPLVSVLFQRGAFGPDDTANTALALAVYGLGLPAFVAQKVLQPLFYAREDTRTPFRYALVSLVVNAALAIGLMPFIGFIAAAIGTTLSAWAMVALLWAGSRRMGDAARLDSRSRRRLWRIAVSATVMGIALFGGELLLGPALGMPALRYAALLALVAGGAAVFFGTGFAIGAFRVEDFRTALRRQR